MRRRSGEDDEESAAEDGRGIEGEDYVGSAQGRGDGCSPGSALYRNQIYAWKKQLLEHGARAFDGGASKDGEAAHERDIEKLHAKIGQLTVE